MELLYDSFAGLRDASAPERVPHAWKAGPQTLLLRRQLEALPDGGVFALTVPKSPYRCPPGPYERACQVAWYFKTSKPKSKVLILDANDKVQSKEALFTKIWKELYPGIVEYRPNSTLVDVDVATLTAKLEFEDVKAGVLNVIPPQRAGAVAAQAGLITVNDKWAGVDFLTYESAAVKNVHVLGDAIAAAPAMPKSAHMANQHAKVAAAAVIALLHDQAPNPSPIVNNTCYSFVTDKEVIHVASVHRYDPEKKTMVVAPRSLRRIRGGERAGRGLRRSVGQEHPRRYARLVKLSQAVVPAEAGTQSAGPALRGDDINRRLDLLDQVPMLDDCHRMAHPSSHFQRMGKDHDSHAEVAIRILERG